MSLRRIVTALLSFALLAAPALAMQPPKGQSEFVPVDAVPLADQLPAAPLLITAYAFVWVAVMFYVWTIWRRMSRVEDEMRVLAQKLPRR
jgi:CcmD family protein